MSALIPAAAVAVAGYLGATASHALIALATLCSAIGITLSAAPGCSIRPAHRRFGAWAIVLSAGLLTGAAGGATARATEALSARIASLPLRSVEGSVLRVVTSRSARRLELRSWTGSTAQLDLFFESPATIQTSQTATQSGQSVEALSTRRIRSWSTAERIFFATDAVHVSGSADIRGRVSQRMSRAISRTGGAAAPLLRALLLGDTAAVEPQRLLLFSRAGVMHLLALSGMHLAVLAMLAGLIGRLLGGRVTAAFATAVVIVSYLVLIGPRPGLVRAALLLTITSGTRAAGRRVPLAAALSLTIMVHIVLDPSAVRSVGFQLSYLSLLGIATVTPVLVERLDGRLPRLLSAPLAAGIGAQLATLPLVLLVFGRVYPLAVVASLILSPVVTLLMAAGVLLGLLAGLFPLFLYPAREVLEAGDRLVEALAARFATGPVVALEGLQPVARAATVWTAAGIAATAIGVTLVFYYRLKYHPNQLWRGRI